MPPELRIQLELRIPLGAFSPRMLKVNTAWSEGYFLRWVKDNVWILGYHSTRSFSFIIVYFHKKFQVISLTPAVSLTRAVSFILAVSLNLGGILNSSGNLNCNKWYSNKLCMSDRFVNTLSILLLQQVLCPPVWNVRSSFPVLVARSCRPLSSLICSRVSIVIVSE